MAGRRGGAGGRCRARAITKSRRIRISDGERFLAVVEDPQVRIVDAGTLAVHATVHADLWRFGLDARGERIAAVDGDGRLTILSVPR